jgi:O-succinylbenzoic acid--CoA ligase
MTETTGGCVYDGVPLPGVQIDIAPDGRIDVIGEQVAAGYREGDDAFSGEGTMRRFRTSDHGVFEQGRLRVMGRNDDVVTVHGVNVALGAIESLIREMVVVRECAVVSLPDDRQGHRIRAFLVTSDPAGAESIAAAVAEQLGSAAKPEITLVPSLPLLPNGKIDRLALRDAGA